MNRYGRGVLSFNGVFAYAIRIRVAKNRGGTMPPAKLSGGDKPTGSHLFSFLRFTHYSLLISHCLSSGPAYHLNYCVLLVFEAIITPWQYSFKFAFDFADNA